MHPAGKVKAQEKLWCAAEGMVVIFKSCSDCKKPNLECKCVEGPAAPIGWDVVAPDYIK